MKGIAETKPTYDINEVKRLVANGQFATIEKVRGFIRTRYPDIGETELIKNVFNTLQLEDFYKTFELNNFPGVYGDVYRVEYDEMTWYVKFMKDEGERIRIRILSCKWDGYQY